MSGARRLGAVVAGWLVLAAVLRAFVLAPERCSPPAPAEVEAAVDRAVDWFETNQLADGRWLYAYERGEADPDERTQLVRHHGVMLSLYQAAAAGEARAFGVAEAGLEWSLDHLVEPAPGQIAMGFEGRSLSTGATALLVAALAEREAITGDGDHDRVLGGLGRFLLAQTDDRGVVSARWDPETGRTQEVSLFFTGEAMWALARMAALDPDGPWSATARRVSTHIALHRDRLEGRIALTPDHWGAYGLDTLEQVAGPLRAHEIAHARRSAGLFAVRVRLEAQNPGTGPIRWTRGAPSLGAGVGTLGEGLSALHRLAGRDHRLADLREPIRETVACNADLLVERQLTARDAGDADEVELVDGAWFRYGRTQQDDQQHALSALVAAGEVLDGDEEDRAHHLDHDDAFGWLVLGLLVALAADPARARRGDRRQPWAFGAAAAAIALAASPLLDALDLSEPTVRLAAGLVVMVTAAVDLWNPARTGRTPMRPGVFLVVLAGGADPGALGALAAVAASTALVWVGTRRAPETWTPRWRLLSRYLAAGALLLGADAAVDGVFEL